MNSFFSRSHLDWADTLPALSTLPPQDDIAANVFARTVGILEVTTTSRHPYSVSGDPENPLYESPPAVSTQTPWVTETILQMRGLLIGARRAM